MTEALAGSESQSACVERFSEEARRAVYKVIALRRDIREFRPDEEIDEESLMRILRAAESARFPPKRREQYLSYRLEGIIEAALNLCIVVDLRSRGEAILGTTVQPEAVRASACCAVQNLWLAARAEGVGVGWVSIVESE